MLPRGRPAWHLVALLIFPAVQIAGALLTRALEPHEAERPDLDLSCAPLTALAMFLHGFFFAGGVNEESGWRGFAVRKLQAGHRPLTAALLVWIFWAVWRLPADLASGDPAAAAVLFVLVAIYAVISDRMWRRLPSPNPDYS